MSFIQKILREKICAENLPGEKIRSEQEFAGELHCSKSTIHRALNELVENGLLISKPGIGYFLPVRHLSRQDTLHCLLIRNSSKPVLQETGSNSLARRLFLLAPDYGITLENRNACGVQLEQLLETLLDQRKVDGIFLQPDLSLEWNRAFSRILREQYPLLLLDYSQLSEQFHNISTNTFDLGFRAAEYLAKQQGNRPLYLGYPRDYILSQRFQGFRAGCDCFGLNSPLCFETLNRDDEAVERELAEFFSAGRQTFDCIFASTPYFTRIAIRQFLRNRWIPGRDFAFVGEGMPPALPGQKFRPSVFLKPTDSIAALALKSMRELVQQPGRKTIYSIRLQADFMEGHSCSKNSNEKKGLV